MVETQVALALIDIAETTLIVMMVCHFDDTNPSGGLEKQTRMLGEALRKAGEDVVILGSTRKFSRVGWSDDQGVPVRLFWTYATPQISGRYLPASLLWAAQLLIWVFFNRARIDVLHIHQIRIHAFVAAIARRLWGIPNILKSATGGSGADIRAIGTRKYFGAWGRRFIIANADRFVATTLSIAEDLLAWGVPQEKIVIIPNGLQMRPVESGETPEARARRFVFLGRLDKDKNVVNLAQAATGMPADKDFHLDFYGTGSLEREVAEILQRDERGRATLKGWHPSPESILGHYGYLLLPSNAEGLSNAMLEAMAQGVVPLTTRVSGCVDHIKPGENGFFFDGVDKESMCAGLIAIAGVPVMQWSELSRRAADYAREHFDIAVVRDRYRSLYAELALQREQSGDA